MALATTSPSPGTSPDGWSRAPAEDLGGLLSKGLCEGLTALKNRGLYVQPAVNRE